MLNIKIFVFGFGSQYKVFIYRFVFSLKSGVEAPAYIRSSIFPIAYIHDYIDTIYPKAVGQCLYFYNSAV